MAVSLASHEPLVQHVYPLPDGGALRLTSAEFVPPSRQRIVLHRGAPAAVGYRAAADAPAAEPSASPPRSGIAPDVLCSAAEPQRGGGRDDDACVRAALRIIDTQLPR